MDHHDVWHRDISSLQVFGRVLVECGVLESPAAVCDYFEAPDRYEPEHDVWCRVGRPRPPSRDDVDAARMIGREGPAGQQLLRKHHGEVLSWDRFCGLLDASGERGAPLMSV